jgi:hypothetical protein
MSTTVKIYTLQPQLDGGWNVESPHILAGSFRANKNGCRVSWGKMDSVVGVRRQEPKDWRRGEMARREWDKEESGVDQKGTGKGGRGK